MKIPEPVGHHDGTMSTRSRATAAPAITTSNGAMRPRARIEQPVRHGPDGRQRDDADASDSIVKAA